MTAPTHINRHDYHGEVQESQDGGSSTINKLEKVENIGHPHKMNERNQVHKRPALAAYHPQHLEKANSIPHPLDKPINREKRMFLD